MGRLGRVVFAFFVAGGLITPARAQYWHALPAISQNADQPEAAFSNDGKKVFYLNGNGQVENIWSAVVADKWGGIIAGAKNPPVQITKFTDRGVVRFLHLLGSPDVLYMRATENGEDYHLYRIADDGSGAAQDITPSTEGVTNVIIGASYNGRYVYYTSNSTNRDKLDVYRYDTQQNTSEDVFPNDKDYVALAWSRDQTKLLMQSPSAGQLSIYDMETTERDPVSLPNSDQLIEAILQPVSQDLIVLTRAGNATSEHTRPFAGGAWTTVPSAGTDWIDFSPSGIYEILRSGTKWGILDQKSREPLTLPAGATPLSFAPKETMVLYSLPGTGGGSELYLYDIPKKSATMIAMVQ